MTEMKKMSQKMTTEIYDVAAEAAAFRVHKQEVLNKLKGLAGPFKIEFKKMKKFRTIKNIMLKKKKKFGKEVVKASKPFYKELRLKRKEQANFKPALKDIRKNGKAAEEKERKAERAQLKEQRKAERAQLKELQNSPEFKLREMIHKFALNVLNTYTRKELLECRGIGDTLATRITNKRRKGKFDDLNNAGLTEKQVKDFVEGLVLTKLMF